MLPTFVALVKCAVGWCDVLYLNVMCMTWCEVECGRDVEWCAEMWWNDSNYGGCEMWCDWCGTDVTRHGAIEMPQNQCDVEYGVVWNVANAGCGKLRCDVKCGDVELWRRMSYAICCVTVVRLMSDVENDAMWYMWWCNVICNMVWCEMCCDVECGWRVD